MTERRSERRARLRESLIEAAHRRIGDQGLAALRARDLAQEVGCAVGAIYNVFDDLDALVLASSLRTLNALNEALVSAPPSASKDEPADRLVALALAYADFAAANPHHWRAVFEHRLPAGTTLPADFSEARDGLFRHIAEPLSALMPRAGREALALRSRTLFSAVHGVVELWLDGRFEAAGTESLKSELESLIRGYARGAES